jgi:hypothetical protein
MPELRREVGDWNALADLHARVAVPATYWRTESGESSAERLAMISCTAHLFGRSADGA